MIQYPIMLIFFWLCCNTIIIGSIHSAPSLYDGSLNYFMFFCFDSQFFVLTLFQVVHMILMLQMLTFSWGDCSIAHKDRYNIFLLQISLKYLFQWASVPIMESINIPTKILNVARHQDAFKFFDWNMCMTDQIAIFFGSLLLWQDGLF